MKLSAVALVLSVLLNVAQLVFVLHSPSFSALLSFASRNTSHIIPVASTPSTGPSSDNDSLSYSPISVASCPPMSREWMVRVNESLQFAPKLLSAEQLERGSRDHPNRARFLRFVKSNNVLYVAFDGNSHFLNRGLSARLQFEQLVFRFPSLPDFDVLINTHDWPACFSSFQKAKLNDFPVFSYSTYTDLLDEGGARKASCADIPFPDFTTNGFPESAPPNLQSDPRLFLNSTWRQDLKRIAAQRPFESRISKMIFRGSRQRYSRTREIYRRRSRGRMYQWNFSQYVDVDFDAPYMPVFNLSNYKYLLHLPGNGYSSRLKYLFYSDSLVFRDRTDSWIEWWSSGLRHGTHYLWVRNISDCAYHVRWASDHSHVVQRLRTNAREYMMSIPDPGVYLCHLIDQYVAQVQRYDPMPPTRAFDLATSFIDSFYPRGNSTVT